MQKIGDGLIEAENDSPITRFLAEGWIATQFGLEFEETARNRVWFRSRSGI